MSDRVDREEMVRFFEGIRDAFPHLTMDLGLSPKEVDLDLNIPQQEGLAFPVYVNLQNEDELHLCVGAFWVEWFPCHKAHIRAMFLEAVSGILSGKDRILEYSRGGRAYKAQLQEPLNGGWQTIATWSTWHLPLPFCRTIRVLQNTHTTDEVL
jgi:hypothetical protein